MNREEGGGRCDEALTLAGFATRLRHESASLGLAVSIDAELAFVGAVAALPEVTGHDLYWAGRSALVHRPEEIALYDTAFGAAVSGNSMTSTAPSDDFADGYVRREEPDERESSVPGSVSISRASRIERLSHKDFALCSESELEQTRALLDRSSLFAPRRATRRLERSRRSGSRPDLRRSIAASVRTDGDLMTLRRLHRRATSRRTVFLLDVSGSMDAYARQLLRLVHVAVASAGSVEAFALGTRLTRLTRELAVRDPDRAMRGAALAVPDWSGGTRLGDALRAFNDRYGIRGVARGAVVVILSDGLDRGDPEELAREMARIERVAHRVIWANPLKASPGYEPLARGMRAALAHIDAFVPAHSVAALEDLAHVISRSVWRQDRGIGGL